GCIRGIRRRRRNAIHKVRIVCGRVASPGVHCSRRFDDPVSLEAYIDFFTVMRVWGPVGVIQKGDFTDTIMSFDLRQCAAKLRLPNLYSVLELNIFRRDCVWVTDYHFYVLIGRESFCNATGDREDGGCR